MKTIIVLLATVLLGACASSGVPTMQVGGFDHDEVAFSQETGTNTIVGHAMLKQRDGEVRTCAGEEVTLLPMGSYGRCYAHALTRARIETDPDELRQWNQYARSTRCDPQGRFEFANLPSGDWMIQTRVTWQTVNTAKVRPIFGIGTAATLARAIRDIAPSTIQQGGVLFDVVSLGATDETRQVVIGSHESSDYIALGTTDPCGPAE